MASISKFIETILNRSDLSLEQAESVLDTIFEGEVSEVQVAAFLAAMRGKGSTAEELAGLARSLREHAVPVKTNVALFKSSPLSLSIQRIIKFLISTSIIFLLFFIYYKLNYNLNRHFDLLFEDRRQLLFS